MGTVNLIFSYEQEDGSLYDNKNIAYFSCLFEYCFVRYSCGMETLPFFPWKGTQEEDDQEPSKNIVGGQCENVYCDEPNARGCRCIWGVTH